ncbi:phenylacetate--CoA ligase family protein [Microbispora sp. RL4-1S]|uniref:Phenylacetate--CoA ligase family protein n=1 Tax=Microbispora oryzae TaxID=2806554 RepID=A0A940WI89_9ACTN|nr:phenylacetate--CoA ligase family protein [Microbispora oryzae]MBP2703233.1 phenylacetate--CoA ligase family protein [Microbispora oryzae]
MAVTATCSPTDARRFRSDYTSFRDRYFSGALTEADWTDWYAERLPAVLRHVTERSPFYRRHLAGVDVAAVTPAGLAELPFTTKADLRREMHAVLSGTPAEAAVYYETTGTTGPSTPCPRGPLDMFASDAHVEESWRRLFRARFGDRMPVIGLMGPCELYAFGDTFGDAARRLDACHVKIWPESPRVGFAKALRLMRDLDVEVVVCAPALCLSLAKAARFHGYDIERDLKVKLFLVLGEICTPAFAANVRSIWDADALPTLYGSQEAMAIATGCTYGNLHLSRPNYIAEVLDPATGEVLGDRGEGELCLTMLVPGIKPLIRYRTGDMVSLDRRGCPCGHPGPVIDVVGRVADQVVIGGAGFRADDIEIAVLDGVRGALGYQVVVDDGPDGRERLTVHLDLLTDIAGDSAAVARGVAARVRERFGVEADVRITDELDPITNTGSFVSWKAARMLDNRAGADNAHRAAAREAAGRQVITS